MLGSATPPAYLGSVFAPTNGGVYPRDEQLLALAWHCGDGGRH